MCNLSVQLSYLNKNVKPVVVLGGNAGINFPISSYFNVEILL